MLKNTLGWMAAALVCGGCSQPGSIVGMAPAELPMPKQIDVVFNHNARSRYRSPLTGEWRNGDDMKAWLIEAIDGATVEVLVACLLYTSPSPRDYAASRMPSSA